MIVSLVIMEMKHIKMVLERKNIEDWQMIL